MELLKRGRFETASEDLAIQAVQAKVIMGLGFLCDAENLALARLRNIGIQYVVVRLQVASSLQPALSVNQMAICELEYFVFTLTLCSHNDSVGAHDVGNRALWVDTNRFECVVVAIVVDHGVRVKTWGRTTATARWCSSHRGCCSCRCG